MLELCLQDYSLSTFQPSILASCVLSSVEDLLDDGCYLFRPGREAAQDAEFVHCYHALRGLLECIFNNCDRLKDIMDCYKTNF